MILLKQTKRIRKGRYTLSFSKANSQGCQVECLGGKNKWTHVFVSIYGSYAMLRDKDLIELPGKNFIVYQINEHSKGGHHEYEMQLMDLKGHVLNEFSSRDNIDFVLDNNNLWFLKTGKKLFNFTSDIELELIKVDIKTGKIKNRIKLDYPKLLNCSYKIVFDAKLTEKRNDMSLRIQYKDDLNNNHSKYIDLSSSIFR